MYMRKNAYYIKNREDDDLTMYKSIGERDLINSLFDLEYDGFIKNNVPYAKDYEFGIHKFVSCSNPQYRFLIQLDGKDETYESRFLLYDGCTLILNNYDFNFEEISNNGFEIRMKYVG